MEELNRVEGGSTVVGMCCMRDEPLFHKYFLKKISKDLKKKAKKDK